MREKLYEMISSLSRKEIALLAAGEIDAHNLRIPPELGEYVAQNPDILSIIAVEVLARQRGFKVEETDMIRLKRDGEWIGDYPVYKYGDDFYLLLDEVIYKLTKADRLEPLKVHKPQTTQQQKIEAPPKPRPRVNIE